MISIIIPSYKGATILKRNLPELIKYLKSRNYLFEIIIIDDGSNDQNTTKNICIENNCVYLENKVNIGKGASVKKAILFCKGNIKIFTDADIPFKFENIDTIIDAIKNENFDMVIGDRKLKESVFYSEISFFRELASKIYRLTIGNFLTKGLKDTQCGLKGFKKEIADDIFSKTTINGFAFDVEVLHIALNKKYSIKRIPVKIRNVEASTVNIFKHSLRMLFDIFMIKYNNFKGLYD